MATFVPIGMRTHVDDPDAWVVNTCSPNDSTEPGDRKRWGWVCPTSRLIKHDYAGITAVSVECLWQGTKIRAEGGRPDPLILDGEWRRGKGKRPIGAWAGEGQPLITTPGEARRRIYIPAFRNLIDAWLQSPEVKDLYDEALAYPGTIYLRDFDTGKGLDRNGPMSHAWLLSEYLNSGEWPS